MGARGDTHDIVILLTAFPLDPKAPPGISQGCLVCVLGQVANALYLFHLPLPLPLSLTRPPDLKPDCLNCSQAASLANEAAGKSVPDTVSAKKKKKGKAAHD